MLLLLPDGSEELLGGPVVNSWFWQNHKDVAVVNTKVVLGRITGVCCFYQMVVKNHRYCRGIVRLAVVLLTVLSTVYFW